MKIKQEILVVDDLTENLLLLEHTLSPLGAGIIKARTGEEALRIVRERDFALAIIDVRMPGMDGYELATILRNDFRSKNIPIIFLTGGSYRDDQVFKGYQSGAVDYIFKPFNPEILIAKVRIYLEWSAQRIELSRHRDHLDQLVKERTAKLGERVKELRCLFSISERIAKPSNSIHEVLKTIVELIPPGWQYPEITGARISFDDLEFITENYRDTEWRQSAQIADSGNVLGRIEVCYLEERPEQSEGPFLQEERDMVNAIARQIGDMLKRERAYKARLDSENKMAMVLDNTADLIAFHDTDRCLQWGNQAYLNSTKKSLESIRGKKCYEIWGLDQSCNNCPVGVAMESGEPNEAELSPQNQCHWPSDQGSWLVRAAPAWDSSGKIIGAIEVAHDITDRKRDEEELKLHRDRLEDLVEKRTAQLESANKELEAFAYSVSHDLRSPLRGINGYPKIPIDDYGDTLDEDGKYILNQVHESACEMGQLIDDLLNFSRLGRRALNRRVFNMNTVVRKSIQEMKDAYPDRKLKVIAGNFPPAFGDPALLREVFRNLLDNAAKYTGGRETGIIEIGMLPIADAHPPKNLLAELKSGNVDQDVKSAYYVRDNGVGFDMNFRHKLFQVFQRLHSTGQFKGTGVGLATVERIMQRHDGQIWADSDVDKGTTFYFTIPEERNRDAQE